LGEATTTDYAEYLATSLKYIVEDISLLKSEQNAWATTMASQLSEENPFSQFVRAFDITDGTYVIDYNAAAEYINSIEDENLRNQTGEAFERYISTFENFSNAYRNNIQ
jgi:aminoglycoside N3'-acetyltransferase